TRFSRDWSSDVCSSDLTEVETQFTYRRCSMYVHSSEFRKISPHKTNLDFNIGLKCSANLSGSPTNHFTLGISIGTAIRKDDIPRSEERRVGKECRVRW